MNLIESLSADVDKSDKYVLLLPVGSLEQHGTQAPLGCDTIIADALCRKAGEQTGCAVLPALYYGDSLCHTSFPGTFSLSINTYKALLTDLILEADRNGFKNLIVLSGHGGNREAAVTAILESDVSINVEYLGYWQLPDVSAEEERLFGKTGYHVTTSEVSMVWHLLKRPVPDSFKGKYPEAVENTSTLCPEKWRQAYPDGGIGGDMSRVSIDKGETLFSFTSEKLADKVRAKRLQFK